MANISNEEDQVFEHSMLWLARDLISTSPILFLDEFQLPDKAASKILSNLLTSFFQLGGVLIATSNRMPEELAKASGVEFAAPPPSRRGLLGNTWGLLAPSKPTEADGSMFGTTKGDFAAFLGVLQSRCEVFQIEGSKDWRRHDPQHLLESTSQATEPLKEPGLQGLEGMAPSNMRHRFEQTVKMLSAKEGMEEVNHMSQLHLPKHFVIASPSASPKEVEQESRAWNTAILASIPEVSDQGTKSSRNIPWANTSLQVYGRTLVVPRHLSGVTKWTFSELCCTNLGPADYITVSSNFHTLILEDVPVLSLLLKNEARRLITLLDALYEARCKLLVKAAAGPDSLFFPETKQSSSPADAPNMLESKDGVYAETFSEIYQDITSPFRPNVVSYSPSASSPAYTSSSLPSTPFTSSNVTRSILADEDSDFGLTHDAGRRSQGLSDGPPGAGNEIGRRVGPDFGHTGSFTGEDERFAYKRAQSRLWELCSKKWWDKEDLWKPLSGDIRRWEQRRPEKAGGIPTSVPDTIGPANRKIDERLFRHGASPFRTAVEPSPKFSWAHAWGMMTWGKKAGAWGKGPDGLKDRVKGEPETHHDP